MGKYFLGYVGKYAYLCSIETNGSYDVSLAVAPTESARCPMVIRYRGTLYPPDRALLEHLIGLDRVPLEAQPALWQGFARDYPVAGWVRECQAQIRLLFELCDEARRISTRIDSASSVPAPVQPLGTPAERHFLWHGDRMGITVDILRDGIQNLALKGIIHNSEVQRRALRIGLGLTLNADERTLAPQWVVWLGHDDMLRHMIDTMWNLDVISCAGGQREKWNTLCGLFVRSDGSRYKRKIKTNICTNPDKLRLLDTAILDSLRLPVKMKGD